MYLNDIIGIYNNLLEVSMYIALGIIALYFQALVYEGGHFVFGRLNKAEIKEFTIGVGWNLFSKKIGETTYNFKIIPLGGYIVFSDDDNNKDKSFRGKTLFSKLSIYASGLIMSIFSVIILMAISIGVYGYKSTEVNNVDGTYKAVSEGHTVLAVNDKNIFTGEEVAYEMNFAGKDGIVILEKEDAVTAKVKLQDLDYKDIDFNRVEEVNVFDSIEMSVKRTFTLIKSTYNEFYKMITKEINLRNYLSGLCDIVNQTSKGIESFLYKLIWFTIYIQITCICINIIPLPILDGGKILIELINSVKKNKISTKAVTMMELGSLGISILVLIFVII